MRKQTRIVRHCLSSTNCNVKMSIKILQQLTLAICLQNKTKSNRDVSDFGAINSTIVNGFGRCGVLNGIWNGIFWIETANKFDDSLSMSIIVDILKLRVDF